MRFYEFLFVYFVSCSLLLHTESSKEKTVECTCDMHYENEIFKFEYWGLEKYLKMGAEMFFFNSNLPRGNFQQLTEAIAANSICNLVNETQHIIIETEPNSIEPNHNDMSLNVGRGVIVEPRNHEALRDVLENFCSKMNIPITLFHSKINKELVELLLTDIECLDSLILLDEDNLDYKSYNELLLSEEYFWSKINIINPVTDSIVLFQTDSGICGEKNDSNILELFQQFHYCGGLFHRYHVTQENGGSLVGNGGFSLRHVETMKRLLRNNPDHRYHAYWEDGLFSHWCLKDPNCKLCPEPVAIYFAASDLPVATAVSSWGFHRNWDVTTFLPSSSNSMMECDFNDRVRQLNQQQHIKQQQQQQQQQQQHKEL